MTSAYADLAYGALLDSKPCAKADKDLFLSSPEKEKLDLGHYRMLCLWPRDLSCVCEPYLTLGHSFVTVYESLKDLSLTLGFGAQLIFDSGLYVFLFSLANLRMLGLQFLNTTLEVLVCFGMLDQA